MIDFELVVGAAAAIRRHLLGGGLTRLEVLPVGAELIRVVEVVHAGLLLLLLGLPHQVQHEFAEVVDLLIEAPAVGAIARVEFVEKLVRQDLATSVLQILVVVDAVARHVLGLWVAGESGVRFARVNFEFKRLLQLSLVHFALVEAHPRVRRNRLFFDTKIILDIHRHLLLRL